jgi:hypothetical protein
LSACTWLNTPPTEQHIDLHFDELERCEKDPGAIGCCSSNLATIASSQKLGMGLNDDWTPVESPSPDIEKRSSQHALFPSRGAALETVVQRVPDASECDPDSQPDDAMDFVTLELNSGPTSSTPVLWFRYWANGHLAANLGSASFDDCQASPQLRVRLDLRPGVLERQDVILARLGVADARTNEPTQIHWLTRDSPLGSVDAFAVAHYVGLTSRGELGANVDVRQYEGACASATNFDVSGTQLSFEDLGVTDWASSLGEAALIIAPASETLQDSWEFVFSAERAVEPSAAPHRALGYSKWFVRDTTWQRAPIRRSRLVGTGDEADRATSSDLRDPSLARRSDDERMIAYAAGTGSASHLELARLEVDKITDVHTIMPEATDSACKALAHPSLVAHESGFLLYFTCCASSDSDCGTGFAQESLWVVQLDDHLVRVPGSKGRPKAVNYDYLDETVVKGSPYQFVSASAVASPRDQHERLWLVARNADQQRVVLLARTTDDHYKQLAFHSQNPVLTAAELCPGEKCELDSIAVARATDARSVWVVAVEGRGANPREQTLHFLNQSLDIPW